MRRILTIVAIAAFSFAFADEIVITRNYGKPKSISQVSLAIVPVIIGDSLKIGQFNRLGIEERRARTKELLWKYLPGQIKFYAGFKTIAVCTTGVVSYLAQDLKIGGKKIQYRVPDNVDVKPLQAPLRQ